MSSSAATIVERWLATFGPVSGGVFCCEKGSDVLAWAASGGMALTGEPGGPPVDTPAPAYGLLEAVARAVRAVSAEVGEQVTLDPAVILAGRAALMGLERRGRMSAGGATRLLRNRDGWCAMTLSRDEDRELVPAMLGVDSVADVWAELEIAARARPAREFADHVQVFGVPCSALPTELRAVDVPWRLAPLTQPDPSSRVSGALVVDLSSLWAGPLCAQLLGLAGATVVKVESTKRPDGARRGNSRFYDWLHDGHLSVALDFSSTEGRAQLARLIDVADVVIEASRPRALGRLGVAPDLVRHRAGRVWVSITGYGRRTPDRVAFGDDAAVAGGLVGWFDGRPVFCADAVADPLSGVCAALAVMASIATGGGQLIDVAMCDVAASFAGAPSEPADHQVVAQGSGWLVSPTRGGRGQVVLPPRPPESTDTAAVLGRDTDRVLRALGDGVVSARRRLRPQ